MSVPYSFTPNTTIKSAEINQNFANLVSGLALDSIHYAASGVGDATIHSTTTTTFQTDAASCTVAAGNNAIIIVGVIARVYFGTYGGYLQITTPSGATARTTTQLLYAASQEYRGETLICMFTVANAGNYTFQFQYKSYQAGQTTAVRVDSIWAIALDNSA